MWYVLFSKGTIDMKIKTPIIAQLEAESGDARQAAEIIETTVHEQRHYANFGGTFHLLKFGKKGEATPVRLCNFTAEIEREIIKNDGHETSRYFTVSGRLESGQPMPTVDVPASEFNSLDWLTTAWGASPQIAVGSRFKDHVAAAIKEHSDPELVKLCQHIGWVQHSDELIYLTASGGIGVNGLNEEARCELQGALADFNLPDPVDPRTLDLSEILAGFRDVHKDGIGLLLLGTAMRATLCQYIPATFSVYMQGTTGTYKSALAGVLQSFWGIKFDGAHLPANWSSTSNANEKVAFLAKDALLVVDDFIARGTRSEVAKMHANAERLLRAQGNQAGRGRLTSKAELRNAFYPRGLILATGEDVPNGRSLQARLVYMNVALGAINIVELTELQRLAKMGELTKIMSSFLQWLASEAKDGQLTQLIELALECDRGNIGKSGHARTQDNLANLLTGLRIFLHFCEEVGEIGAPETEGFMDHATETARRLVTLQASLDHESSDAQRFIELIQIAVSSGKAHIECCSGGNPENSRALGWREVDTGTFRRIEAMGSRIGWVDGETLYLSPGASLSAIKSISSALDNHFGSSERAISKSLREAGLLSRCDKGRNTTKVSILGVRPNVYAFKIADVFDLDSQTNVPIGYDPSEIPF